MNFCAVYVAWAVRDELPKLLIGCAILVLSL